MFELRSPDGSLISVKTDIVRLGRAGDNTVVINDPTVSRYHINFYIKEGALIAEDAGSQNGFLVNGKSIKDSTLLNLGDQVVVGSRVYTVFKNGVAQMPRAGAPMGVPSLNTPLTAGSRRAPVRDVSTLRFLGTAGFVLLLLAAYFRSQEIKGPSPAAYNPKSATQGINTDGYRSDAFRAKSITEVQAESKFRESLRDYYNTNYSRAMLGFREALTLNPSHEGSTTYLQLAETELNKQLTTLLKDGEQSYANLQYSRARGQSMRILTIISEQIPSYGRKIAQDVLAGQNNPNGTQEDNLLNVPCDKAKDPSICNKALDLLKKSRQKLGEEDTLK